MKDNMMVSISCTTYNHVAYIRQCLDGFLMQKCNFNYEILIHDDASTDGTIDIIKEYQEKYPEIIKPYIQKENQWSQGVRGMNAKYNFSRAKGKYIAMCEGDDYWTDPLKLQKQVDFLEMNEECSLVYHKVRIYDNDLEIFKEDFLKYPDNVSKKSLQELVEYGNFMHTPTVMFRNNITCPNDYNLPVGDYLLWFLNGQKGDFGFLPQEMAIYRLSNSSTWGKKSKYYRVSIWLKVLLKLKEYTDDPLIKNALKRQALRNYRTILQTEELSFFKKMRLLKLILLIEPKFIKRLILNDK